RLWKLSDSGGRRCFARPSPTTSTTCPGSSTGAFDDGAPHEDMSESEEKPPPPPVPEAHHLSALRLFAVIALFLVAPAYALWKSARFQNLIHGVSQTRLAEALGRPVTFRTVELRMFPPAIRLADVRIGNDPSLEGPLFSAEEISIGG